MIKTVKLLFQHCPSLKKRYTYQIELEWDCLKATIRRMVLDDAKFKMQNEVCMFEKAVI